MLQKVAFSLITTRLLSFFLCNVNRTDLPLGTLTKQQGSLDKVPHLCLDNSRNYSDH